MVRYRCYFLGDTKSRAGASSSIEAAADLEAETDDGARTAAEALYRQRRNQMRGFEVWQADRLVCRHLPKPAKAELQAGTLSPSGVHTHER
jgi:hypothetical protein